MFQAAFECFPWDLDLEGYDDALARLAVDIGVDAVRVAAVHEGIRELRPRAAEADRAFVCRAAAHFQPDPRCYAGLRIRPVPAAWMKTRNPLEKIAEAAEKHRLKLRVSLSCCQGDAVVERYPHAACVDFFGQPSERRLCPSNPDVRAYLGALVEDVTTNYAVAELHLESADFGPGPSTGYLNSLQLPTGLSTLFFDTCHCASCLQRASDSGVDVSGFRADLHELYLKLTRFEPAVATSPADLIGTNARVAAFQRARRDTVASLVQSMTARCKALLRVALPASSETTAAVPGELGMHCGGFCIPVVSGRERDWPSDAIAQAGGPSRCDAHFRSYPPGAVDSSSLVTAVHRATQLGIASITFHNYGVCPESCLDWARQAIRYARREAR